MFHAAGWTFPWSIPFSFATQARAPSLLHYNPCKPRLWLDHAADRGLLFNLEALLELSCHTLLWSSHSAGALPPLKGLERYIIPIDKDRDYEPPQRKEAPTSNQNNNCRSCTHSSFALSARIKGFSVCPRLRLDVCPRLSLVLPS
jgi:hypothetical protein